MQGLTAQPVCLASRTRSAWCVLSIAQIETNLPTSQYTSLVARSAGCGVVVVSLTRYSFHNWRFVRRLTQIVLDDQYNSSRPDSLIKFYECAPRSVSVVEQLILANTRIMFASQYNVAVVHGAAHIAVAPPATSYHDAGFDLDE